MTENELSKLMNMLGDIDESAIEFELIVEDSLLENHQQINAIDNKHGDNGKWYSILIRDKFGSYEGKERYEGNSVKFSKKRRSTSGKPVIVKNSAYSAADGIHASEDDIFEDQLEKLDKEIKDYARNFVYDNQALLIKYYYSNDENVQRDIIEEIKQNMKTKNYSKESVAPMTQKELDALLKDVVID